MEWGWKKDRDVVVPTKTDFNPAPDWLLKVVRCKCKDGSRNQCGLMTCSCRKNGLECVAACGDCRGETCNNPSSLPDNHKDLEEADDDDLNLNV